MTLSNTTAVVFQPVSQQRALIWCVLASITLHTAALLGVSRREAPVPPAKILLVLTARLAPPSAAPPAPAQSPQPEVASPPPTHDPVPTPRPVLAKPIPAPTPSPQKIAPADPAKPSLPDTSAAPSTAPASTQPAGPAESKAGPQAATAAPEAAAKPGAEADGGTLEQYRLALIVAARRYKRYPAIAMEKGWQGKVEVRMVIGANGMTSNASIKTSSGHEILDNQALDMIKKGKTTVQIPASLRGREFTIDVPVIFNLENPST